MFFSRSQFKIQKTPATYINTLPPSTPSVPQTGDQKMGNKKKRSQQQLKQIINVNIEEITVMK